MTDQELSIAAKNLALDHIRGDIGRGMTLDEIQKSWHGSVGPGYDVRIVANQSYTIKVSRVNSIDCEFVYSLRKLYAQCKRGQLSLL